MSDTIQDGISADHRQWAMFVHLSLFAGYVVPLAGLVVPIILWQMKKDESEFIDANGKMVVNWILTHLILAIGFGLLCLIIIGIPLILLLALAAVVFPIIGAIKANEGTLWKYPMVIEFFR